MIVVTVKLVSAVDGHCEHLGTAIIGNDATGTSTMGNYIVWLSKRGLARSTWKTGCAERFPRKRLGAWDLLYRALRNTVGGRNGG